jgi:polyisoprenoid-binding protein YceI
MNAFAHTRNFALPLCLMLLASSALAQHRTFTVSPEMSEVKMTLKTNHEIVNGTFHVQAGSIDYDAAESRISGSVVVAAGSGKTGNDSRDKKMDKDVLKVEQYTTVAFVPKSYTGTLAASGDSTIQVSGVLTLLGTPHDVTIPMQIHIDGAHCAAKAQFVVPYVQWGLKNPSFMIWKAANDVAIDLNLVGRIAN